MKNLPIHGSNNNLVSAAASYQEKVREMKKKANKGDLNAHYWLSGEYLPSRRRSKLIPKHNLKRNDKLAVKHLRKAAEKGHPDALLRLAKLHVHLDSDVLKNNLDKALEFIVQAAEYDSANARHVLARIRLEEGSIWQLLREDGKGRGSPWGFSKEKTTQYSELADEFIDEHRGKRKVRKRPLKHSNQIPEDGEALHPVKGKPYSVARTDWKGVTQTPQKSGVYERLFFKKDTGSRVNYSYWDGDVWSKRSISPQDLVDDLADGSLEASKSQRLPWRGLVNDPDAPYTTYVDPLGTLRPGFDFGGYVGQKEFGSPRIEMIHVAKTIQSPDGAYLTACGHRPPANEHLISWSSGMEIKIVDGHQPDLCPACRKIVFK